MAKDEIKIKPVVVPAKEEKTYGLGALSFLRIMGGDPNGPMRFDYSLCPYDGVEMLSSAAVNRTFPDIKDLFATHPKLAVAYKSLLEAITEIEEKQK